MLLAFVLTLLVCPICQMPNAYTDAVDLYLSLNMNGGQNLQLSNGDVYGINPDDQIYSSLWITPFPVILGESGNADYPIKITNMLTGTSVNGRLLSAEELQALQNPATGLTGPNAPPPSANMQPPPAQPAPTMQPPPPKPSMQPPKSPTGPAQPKVPPPTPPKTNPVIQTPKTY